MERKGFHFDWMLNSNINNLSAKLWIVPLIESIHMVNKAKAFIKDKTRKAIWL